MSKPKRKVGERFEQKDSGIMYLWEQTPAGQRNKKIKRITPYKNPKKANNKTNIAEHPKKNKAVPRSCKSNPDDLPNMLKLRGSKPNIHIAEHDRPQKVRVIVDRRTSYMVAPERVEQFKRERGLV